MQTIPAWKDGVGRGDTFKKHMDEEYYIVTDFDLPDDFDEFRKSVFGKQINRCQYRTDDAGFSFLRILAHNFYKNEIFPAEWRILCIDD